MQKYRLYLKRMAGLPPSARLPSDFFLATSAHSSPASGSAAPSLAIPGPPLYPAHAVPALRPHPYGAPMSPFAAAAAGGAPHPRMPYMGPAGYPAPGMMPMSATPGVYPGPSPVGPSYYNPYLPYNAHSALGRPPGYRLPSMSFPANSSGAPSGTDTVSGQTEVSAGGSAFFVFLTIFLPGMLVETRMLMDNCFWSRSSQAHLPP